MFRKQPLAFISLSSGGGAPELRSVISETLARYDAVPVFADDVPSGSNWSTAIQESLRDADLVIADVTDASPNAMIEVGMALGMGKPLLLLSQSRSTDLPMNLRARQVAVYQPDDMGSVRRYLELSLRDSLGERAPLVP